jgi:hypothetical protein
MNRDGSPVKKLGIIDFQDGCHCVRWGSLGFVCVRSGSALRVRVCL